MTNKEKYKQAFSVLHASDKISLEVEDMIKFQKRHKMNIAIAVVAVCIILAGGSVSAYATDVGGIQEKVSIWIKGVATDTEMEVNEDGSFTFTYEEDGERVKMGGGGVSIGDDGETAKLPPEEFVEDMNSSANVESDKSGKTWVYYYDQKVEITDLFDKNGVCRIVLSHKGEKAYLEITDEKDGAYSISKTNEISKEKEKLYTVVKK
ncbi:MAG: hypothetical protein HFI37_07980 [Lachnospiraceae bacterium]|nr:hypothetical protein [Lachnospiraceae bacterium]